MTNDERLKLFIETALTHRGDIKPFDPAKGDTWEAEENGLALYNRDGEISLFIPVSTLLYGNGCGLLKAACGEACYERGYVLTYYQAVAQQSVLLPDSERLAFICEHLRKE